VVWYLNKAGSTKSLTLLQQTFQFFQLADRAKFSFRALHIPGVKNILADALSRPDKPPPTEWQIHPDIFWKLIFPLRSPEVDLFATSANTQLAKFVSPIPERSAWKIDALSLDWENLNAYAFPPTALLPLILRKIEGTKKLSLTLVAPFWPTRGWFVILRRIAIDKGPLPLVNYLLRQPLTNTYHHFPEVLSLHVWEICKRP
jgi:hypothetical protein